MNNTKQEIEQKIQDETELINRLESNPVDPEYYYVQGKKTIHAKGEYARYLTKISDAYWRRRNLWAKLEEFKND